jgi:hypothetical protein
MVWLRPSSLPALPWLRLMCVLLVVDGAAASAASGTAVTWRAVEAFVPVAADGYVAPYAETKSPNREEHGLAVNTVRHQGAPAAAELTYRGTAGRFDLTLLAIAEEDGESRYRIEINGRALREVINPPSSEKRRAVTHRWPALALAPGDRIRVVFRGHSNGRIPEGDGFAWARGRWRSVTLTQVQP